jgi:FKBP-type peptidyl-prolyl cis-trans isomerase 2
MCVNEGRIHHCSVGGLAPNLVVELANGSRAVVLDVSEQSVKLDANSMLAGKKLVFEIELVGIEASS